MVAVDAAGNVSAASAPVTVTTADPPAAGSCKAGHPHRLEPQAHAFTLNGAPGTVAGH
ncbi:hypothetical protein ABZ807_12390 [Micromonospora sp. NPDC047548]|uniref:hypothetical protein n=1 Tax=Micromonospora sp. NPDC047548 TaxID=3155624 RepID=UPI0033E8523B